MSRIQLKITCHTKNQEKHNLDEKRQLTYQNDCKTVILKICQQPNINYLETHAKKKSLSKEIEVIQKNQLKITELKNTITFKNSLCGVNSRVMTEDRVRELEDK